MNDLIKLGNELVEALEEADFALESEGFSTEEDKKIIQAWKNALEIYNDQPQLDADWMNRL